MPVKWWRRKAVLIPYAFLLRDTFSSGCDASIAQITLRIRDDRLGDGAAVQSRVKRPARKLATSIITSYGSHNYQLEHH